jgi:uncharacterized membrane protein
MAWYELVVFVHVVSAIVLVGGGLLATPSVNGAIRSASSISEIRRWLTVGRPLDVLSPVSSLVLLGSGIYLASVGRWWEAGWVQVALGLWVVNAVLAGRLVKPVMGRLGGLVARSSGEEIDPAVEQLRSSPALAVFPLVLTGNDLGVLFLMVVKPPGHLNPLLVVLVAQLAVFGVRTGWRFIRSSQVARSQGSGAAQPAPGG